MSQSAPKVMLSAIQPTNTITLGNYLGAIKNWVRYQKDYRCYFFAVDLHAITVRQEPQALRENTLFAMATYLAAGIDPSRCTLFVQSQVPQHAALAWLLNCFGYMGELSRMTQYKDKSARAGQNIPVGLFTYPLLMAADILLYNTALVPVGADQKQHIELTRDLALRLNALYGDDTLVVPEPFIAAQGARIMDLQVPTKKMSKSDSQESGTVYLTDTAKDIERKFKRAVTDSGAEITYDETEKPGVKNLIDIQATITGRTTAEIVAGYAGKLYGHLKVDTADIVLAELQPLQTRTKEYLADRGELLRILAAGSAAARETAAATLERLTARLGLLT